jgi:hypothetical protein
MARTIIGSEPGSPSPASPDNVHSWRGDLRTLSIMLAIFAVVYMFGVCWMKTPMAVYSFCGNCLGSARADLNTGTIWGGGLCLVAWLLASASGFRSAMRFVRVAGVAAAGIWVVASGFVWGWW